MIQTLEAKLKKFEGKQGAPSDVLPRFRVFAIEALLDGRYARVNLASGNRKIMRAEQLGIEPYTPRECPPQRVVGQGKAGDALAVPEQVPEAVVEHVESEDERVSGIAEAIVRDFGMW